MAAIESYFPNWRELAIHESSPSPGGASRRIADESTNYTATQYFPKVPGGVTDPKSGFRSENLEAQTFPDESFDIVVTQDVFEHMFHPDRAIQEIARTLKPGGAHICSVPIVRKDQVSVRRASMDAGGEISYLVPPEYHGNPASDEGALVTVDWGFDICGYLSRASGLEVTMLVIDDVSRGIRAEFIEILVCRKGNSLTTI